MKKNIIFFYLMLLGLSCSGTSDKYITNDILLSPSVISSLDGLLSFYIPKNWEIVKNIQNPNYEFCIASQNKKYLIFMNEIKAPNNVRELIDDEGLQTLEKLTFEALKLKLSDSLRIVASGKVKIINNTRVYEFEYLGKKNPNICRIILIDAGKKYYEFSAVPNSDKAISKISLDSLFSIQETMLKNIKNK